MDVFRIPGEIAAGIVRHALEEYPRECCGILGGDGDGVRKLFPLHNIDLDPVMRYNAHPKELKQVTDEIYDQGWEVVCIYHSHTQSPAFPSPTDVERATYPDAVYALVSLEDKTAPELRAFRIVDGTISELRVVRQGEAGEE